jgi:PTS system mannose-specific IID component
VPVVLIFLGIYNVGHLGLRLWGIRAGWRSGLRVAASLGSPLLRRGPQYVARAVMLLAGAALPLVIRRVLDGLPSVHDGEPDDLVHAVGGIVPATAILAAVLLGTLLVRLHGRVEGWRAALVVLLVLIIYSVVR